MTEGVIIVKGEGGLYMGVKVRKLGDVSASFGYREHHGVG